MNRLLKFLPLPYYGPNDDSGKSATQIEREGIKVTSNTTQQKEDDNKEDETDDENKLDKDAEGQKEEDQEQEEAEGEEDSEEGEKEDDSEEEGTKELTAEQKEINALKRKLERIQKRVGKTTGERDAIKKELATVKASLDAKIADGEQPLDEAEVNRRAKQIAENELTVREFNQAQEHLISDATKIDKNFMSKVNDMAQEVAPLPEFFVGALSDLDNGGAVLNYLTDNHDEYEDLLNKRGPVRVIKGLVEISNKLIEASKPKPKPISKVPNPPKAPGGNTRNTDVIPAKPTENMPEFIRVRNKQVEERRKAKMGG